LLRKVGFSVLRKFACENSSFPPIHSGDVGVSVSREQLLYFIIGKPGKNLFILILPEVSIDPGEIDDDDFILEGRDLFEPEGDG
jgi:hypothetical protein